ncbi:MAG: hypothetical protein ACHBNF_14795 [Chromatiales bacterium]
MSRDSIRGFAHLGLLATLLHNFPNPAGSNVRKSSAPGKIIRPRGQLTDSLLTIRQFKLRDDRRMIRFQELHVSPKSTDSS